MKKKRRSQDEIFRAIMRDLRLPILTGPIDPIAKLLVTVENRRPLKTSVAAR